MAHGSILIFNSYLSLTAASSHYQDKYKWLCDETLFRLLTSHYPKLKDTIAFTRGGHGRRWCRASLAGWNKEEGSNNQLIDWQGGGWVHGWCQADPADQKGVRMGSIWMNDKQTTNDVMNASLHQQKNKWAKVKTKKTKEEMMNNLRVVGQRIVKESANKTQ